MCRRSRLSAAIERIETDRIITLANSNDNSNPRPWLSIPGELWSWLRNISNISHFKGESKNEWTNGHYSITFFSANAVDNKNNKGKEGKVNQV